MQQNEEMTQEQWGKFHIQRCSKQQEINRLEKERKQLKAESRKQLKDDIKAVALCALLCLITVFAIWGIN